MTGEVVSIGKAAINSDRRASFMAAVAQSFELYVADYGHEPDAIVYTLSGIKQPSRTAWVIEGESRGGATSVLCLAAMHMAREAQADRDWQVEDVPA
jgi:hypothetical protein